MYRLCDLGSDVVLYNKMGKRSQTFGPQCTSEWAYLCRRRHIWSVPVRSLWSPLAMNDEKGREQEVETQFSEAQSPVSVFDRQSKGYRRREHGEIRGGGGYNPSMKECTERMYRETHTVRREETAIQVDSSHLSVKRFFCDFITCCLHTTIAGQSNLEHLLAGYCLLHWTMQAPLLPLSLAYTFISLTNHSTFYFQAHTAHIFTHSYIFISTYQCIQFHAESTTLFQRVL